MRANYSKEDIETSLTEIGICAGDDVFIHSNLGFFGVLEGCKDADNLCESFIQAIGNIIGNTGTIIVPTFSYSYCHNEVYNPDVTGTTCGMLSEYILKKLPNNRSLDPNFSISGIGENIEYYTSCNIHESFGEGCFWEKFLNKNGKIICMNFDSGSTFVHYIEKYNNVSYRYNKAFNGVTEYKGNLYKDYAVHFVFDGENDSPSMERVDELCKENHISNQVNLGKGTILAFNSKEYFDFFSGLLKDRPRVLCKVEN